MSNREKLLMKKIKKREKVKKELVLKKQHQQQVQSNHVKAPITNPISPVLIKSMFFFMIFRSSVVFNKISFLFIDKQKSPKSITNGTVGKYSKKRKQPIVEEVVQTSKYMAWQFLIFLG